MKIWGVLWRSLLWYTAAGAVLGGLHGCAIWPIVIFMINTTETTEPWLVWGVRVATVGFGAAGLAAGWVVARRGLWRMPAPTGAVIGLLAGIPVGGLLLAFIYAFAFPIGAAVGAAYGAATGLVNSIVVIIAHRAFGGKTCRRAMVRGSAIGGALTPILPWTLAWSFHGLSESVSDVPVWGELIVGVGPPSLVLCFVSLWFGGLMTDRFSGRVGEGP